MAVINNVVMESLAYSVSAHRSVHERSQLCHCVFLALLQRARRKAIGEGKLVALRRGWQPPSLFMALSFFSSPHDCIPVSPEGLLVPASQPKLWTTPALDACSGERAVLTQRGLGGWWSSTITLPGHWVRSENSARELDKTLHHCHLLTGGLEC